MAHCKEQATHTDESVVIALPNVHAKLDTLTGGWRKKVNHIVEGGDSGCREDKSNGLPKKMI